MFFDKITPWQKYEQSLYKISPLTYFDQDVKIASYQKQKERYQICSTCPEFIKISKQCKKSGAFMDLKIKDLSSECPIKKW